MTDIVPVPEGIHSTPFPTNADRTAGTYNPKVAAWGDSTRAQSVRDREIAVATHANAVATRELAEAAEESKTAAAASVTAAASEADRSRDEADRSRSEADRAEAGADSAWAAMAALGEEAALPSLAGKAGMSLRVNAAGNGVEWGSVGAEIGGIYVGAKKPTLGTWLETNAVYLQSSYPVLFAALGLVPSVASWTRRTQGTLNNTRSLAYGNGMYVAVGASSSSSNMGASSPDGVTWTDRVVNAAYAVIFAAGVFVAVGQNAAATSADGVTWVSRTIPSGSWQKIAYGGGLFVAVGGTNTIATSPDGINWTSRSLAGPMSIVAYGGGRFVGLQPDATGGGLTSTDGINWTPISVPPYSSIIELTYGNNMFVGVGNGGSITSKDGLTWVLQGMPAAGVGSGAYRAVAFYNGRFIAVGSNSLSGPALCADSPDGVTWTIRFMLGSQNTAIVAANGLIVSAGSLMHTAPMFPYDTATQFYVPAPPVVVGLKSWMKAGD